MKRVYLAISLFLLLFTSCVEVKPFQRANLNNRHMQMGSSSLDSYENNVSNYREGATGTNGEKTGGGCGCN